MSYDEEHEAGYETADGYDLTVVGTTYWDEGGHGWSSTWEGTVTHVWLRLPMPNSRRRANVEAYDLMTTSYHDPDNEGHLSLDDLDMDELEELLCDAARDACSARRVDRYVDSLDCY